MISRLVAVALLGACSLAAQGSSREFYPWWDSQVAKDLNLSEEQADRVRSIVNEYRDRLVEMRSGLLKTEAALGEVMDEEVPDAKRFRDALDRMIESRNNLTKSYSEMAYRLRAVLTAGQWRELRRRLPASVARPKEKQPKP